MTMKNRVKGELLIYVSLVLFFSLLTLKINTFLTSFFPMEGWLLLIMAGVGIGYIMSNSNS